MKRKIRLLSVTCLPTLLIPLVACHPNPTNYLLAKVLTVVSTMVSTKVPAKVPTMVLTVVLTVVSIQVLTVVSIEVLDERDESVRGLAEKFC